MKYANPLNKLADDWRTLFVLMDRPSQDPGRDSRSLRPLVSKKAVIGLFPHTQWLRFLLEFDGCLLREYLTMSHWHGNPTRLYYGASTALLAFYRRSVFITHLKHRIRRVVERAPINNNWHWFLRNWLTGTMDIMLFSFGVSICTGM